MSETLNLKFEEIVKSIRLNEEHLNAAKRRGEMDVVRWYEESIKKLYSDLQRIK